jgi:hypothetical protein
VFTDNTSFLITENSAHILLTRTFTMLANATLAGQLKFTASRIVKNAEAQRAQVLPELKQLDGHRQSLPVMGEDDGNKFARAVQNCVNPKVPDALKTNY